VCYVVRDWLWVARWDACCICEFVEGVDIANLLSCDLKRSKYVRVVLSVLKCFK